MTFEKKLSTLSTISENSLKHLGNYIQYVHSHEVATQMMESKNIYELPTFEGKIVIQVIDDVVNYKFIPSHKFSKIINNTILSKQSLLVDDMTKKLKNTLTKAYKNVL